jgi:nucleoside-diphosphate-sugar epimerase
MAPRFDRSIVAPSDQILVTGANGFIGSRLVAALQSGGFRHIRCLVRSSSDHTRLREAIGVNTEGIEIFQGNLLSTRDCQDLVKDAAVIFHLAGARGVKSFPDAFLNTVVTTRNLLDAAASSGRLRRFVNVSSFSVYSTYHLRHGDLLDETCGLENRPILRRDPYCYAKVNQDLLVKEYCERARLPYVTVRPGVVYGPGNFGIHGRIGIGTFGIFLHLGGGNQIPLVYVDNCADAILLAGVVPDVESETFNVVDDNLPSSRAFLRLYKRRVRRFRSIYVPYRVFSLFCSAWERYANWSQGQLPPIFNRRMCSSYWKGLRYSNQRLKDRLGWVPLVSLNDALSRYFDSERERAGLRS